MANNMRKMYTEKQISDIAKSSVSGGTKLYNISAQPSIEGSAILVNCISTSNNPKSTEKIIAVSLPNTSNYIFVNVVYIGGVGWQFSLLHLSDDMQIATGMITNQSDFTITPL